MKTRRNYINCRPVAEQWGVVSQGKTGHTVDPSGEEYDKESDTSTVTNPILCGGVQSPV